MALTANKVIRHKENPLIDRYQLASGAHTIYKGANVNLNSSGYAKIGSDTLTEKFIGVALESKIIAAGDNGSNGLFEIEVMVTGCNRILEMDITSNITVANVLNSVYVDDDEKVDISSGITNTTGGLVGIIRKFISTNKAWVQLKN